MALTTEGISGSMSSSAELLHVQAMALTDGDISSSMSSSGGASLTLWQRLIRVKLTAQNLQVLPDQTAAHLRRSESDQGSSATWATSSAASAGGRVDELIWDIYWDENNFDALDVARAIHVTSTRKNTVDGRVVGRGVARHVEWRSPRTTSCPARMTD